MPRTSRVHDRRACERCGGDLPDGCSVNRRFCPSCGHERRALTFLYQADRALAAAGSSRDAVNRAIGELESPR